MPLMTAASTSSRERGVWAASNSLNLSFFGFLVMSAGVASLPTPDLRVISPFAASSLRARASFTLSFGTATVAPLLRASALLTLWE